MSSSYVVKKAKWEWLADKAISNKHSYLWQLKTWEWPIGFLFCWWYCDPQRSWS